MLKKVMLTLLVMSTVALAGCAADYQTGDISKSYCSSTDPEFRAMIKNNLQGMGISLGVDYCTMHGLVDAMATMNKISKEAAAQNDNFERQ